MLPSSPSLLVLVAVAIFLAGSSLQEDPTTTEPETTVRKLYILYTINFLSNQLPGPQLDPNPEMKNGTDSTSKKNRMAGSPDTKYSCYRVSFTVWNRGYCSYYCGRYGFPLYYWYPYRYLASLFSYTHLILIILTLGAGAVSTDTKEYGPMNADNK